MSRPSNVESRFQILGMDCYMKEVSTLRSEEGTYHDHVARKCWAIRCRISNLGHESLHKMKKISNMTMS